jgi:phosphoenolpyruvate---glycerone phosphotransferase subunit DhaL
MQTFSLNRGSILADKLIVAIQQNKQYLSDIDGAIGDGDHGINMNKGFTMWKDALVNEPGDLAHSLQLLGRILMLKIGGSMGPLYGKFFMAFGKSLQGKEEIGKEDFLLSLKASLEAIQSISKAQVGDKTLMDVLIPAVTAYEKALQEGLSFAQSLEKMQQAATAGRDSTKDLVAKIGRSSRLGERSKGTIDAGAASACLILNTIAEGIVELLNR